MSESEHDHCHIYPSESGHVASPDCWCEPLGYWIKGSDGEPIFVIEHDDLHDTPDSDGQIHLRSTMLSIRECDVNDWITQVLDHIRFPSLD